MVPLEQGPRGRACAWASLCGCAQLRARARPNTLGSKSPQLSAGRWRARARPGSQAGTNNCAESGRLLCRMPPGCGAQVASDVPQDTWLAGSAYELARHGLPRPPCRETEGTQAANRLDLNCSKPRMLCVSD